MKDLVLPIILAIIGSVGLFSFIQFLIQRHDSKKKDDKNIEQKLDEMEKNLGGRIDTINNNFEEHKATLARTHILRFADEQKLYVKQGMSHSEKYFEQQLLDIKTYNTYCDKHPDFSNGLTIFATKYIEDEYQRLYMPHSNPMEGGDNSK